MGLLEKRAILDFQENKYPSLMAQVQDAAGFPVEMEVDWDSLMKGDIAPNEEHFTNVYFEPLIGAFKDITCDSLGKEALAKSLKKIIVKNEGDIFSSSACYSFENGVLGVNHEPHTNTDAVEERKNYLSNFLMQSL